MPRKVWLHDLLGSLIAALAVALLTNKKFVLLRCINVSNPSENKWFGIERRRYLHLDFCYTIDTTATVRLLHFSHGAHDHVHDAAAGTGDGSEHNSLRNVLSSGEAWLVKGQA